MYHPIKMRFLETHEISDFVVVSVCLFWATCFVSYHVFTRAPLEPFQGGAPLFFRPPPQPAAPWGQVDKAALQVKNTEEKLADARAQATKVKETTKQQTGRPAILSPWGGGSGPSGRRRCLADHAQPVGDPRILFL